ncbi:Protein CBG10380 [Caenorhabditis briggsae]|uniref:Protein CBG10380 n=2 Tax=Caenorhabditis briggsae TaxID=6238 RepID=A8XB28_CAEBR|nr:Protein CBG10380 [Caenorhabditis briggsae]ULT87124.1 hypothetical protein L3Y34_006715 [Caenorhabditis briggsae]CAP29808.2 Protein CBG10380 [Caenorhabditis briggsae]
MLLHLSSLLIFTISLANCQTCSFSKSAVNASWTVAQNGTLQISYQNNGISNNQWTAIGFGPDMYNQQVIVLMVQNNQVSIRTGSTSGHAPPTFSSQNSANLQNVNYSGTTINATTSVPLNFNGVNLGGCQTWNFVQTGPLSNGQMEPHTSRPNQVNNVCASQCV